ncbi:Lyso-phosphatidylcholine acyltransferase [Vermiconidia calcicola]|uniref:Lyso-phosphatidylcholine acyltransferase n=1 Tax=Vermiconidia calcicola TaxID=1690605 RepID=A0ACC3MKM6_9PEZI|nr:Lyso-phosphatidylcholine acyltransferase [Vermiconidia calcicola]
METQERPYEPPWTFRLPSTLTIGVVAFLSRSFLYAFSKTETEGLDRLLDALDRRKDETKRDRGLITVSNHLSVLDDPMIWGVLPFRYHWDSSNMRWSLGSYDICFKNGQSGFVSGFFTYGNTLPIQRAAHSKYGGLFQPTMTEVIRLLSDPHGQLARQQHKVPTPTQDTSPNSLPASDPFSDSELTYTTNGLDSFPAPSAYPSRRFSWVHIFPEGMIHQHPDKVMRYFKWGVARLILETEPCPDVLPMWIDGPQHAMSEKRTWPRPLPRPGKEISVTFGDFVDSEAVFGPFRERWRELKDKSRRKRLHSMPESAELENETLGELHDDTLKFGPEAEQLRIDVTLAVRNEVLKVRRSRGLLDEDPKRGLAETYRKEGSKREGEMKDRSVVKDM